MVLVDGLGHRPGELDFFQNIKGRARMHADDGQLMLGHRARFVEDACRHMDLSKIVNGGRHPQALDVLPRKSHMGGDGPAQLGHPALVTGSIGIALFNGCGHGLDDGPHVFAQPFTTVIDLIAHFQERAAVGDFLNHSGEFAFGVKISGSGHHPWCLVDFAVAVAFILQVPSLLTEAVQGTVRGVA